MSPRLEDLEQELTGAEEAALGATVAQMMVRIRALNAADRRTLAAQALEWSNSTPPVDESRWNPRRTLIGVVLHATGVEVIASEAERALRREIQRDLSQLNGNLEAYKSLEWVPPRTDC